MFRFRRLVGVVLEDFGLRSRSTPPVPTPVEPAPLEPEPPAAAIQELPPGVVWHGPARRGPDLQRFVDHLVARRSTPG
ncbi:MAG TPA: hypothetical protein VM143_09770 [Acidimicrobiales bacterium]|nr:hypothetical protein [Acidimicrobiales bacterium]